MPGHTLQASPWILSRLFHPIRSRCHWLWPPHVWSLTQFYSVGFFTFKDPCTKVWFHKKNHQDFGQLIFAVSWNLHTTLNASHQMVSLHLWCCPGNSLIFFTRSKLKEVQSASRPGHRTGFLGTRQCQWPGLRTVQDLSYIETRHHTRATESAVANQLLPYLERMRQVTLRWPKKPRSCG